jgi:excisionase family DNA binding protein
MAEDEQGKKKPARPFIKPLAYRPTDAARRAGIGRTKLYELMDKGELPSHKEGRMRLVLDEDIEAWLRRLPPK